MIRKAFILGAGLGTRLRPLTDVLPKPLVPVFHEPMANYALRHCIEAGITEFAINTHHIPEAWQKTYPSQSFEGYPLTFFHEPILLETGGGIRNIAPFIGDDSLLVYNGDILTNIDISKLIAHHETSGNIATLALRSQGNNCNVNISGDHVTDMRNTFSNTPGTHQFTGIYCLNPEILTLIPNERIVSIVPAFIELIRQKKLGAVVLDEGDWLDIGTPTAYREAHTHLAKSRHDNIHTSAHIHPGADVNPNCIIGPNAIIGNNAILTDTIVWQNTHVDAGAHYQNAIITPSGVLDS